jgi:uncharacterized cupredoxin-like copper-binding protein
MSINRRTVLLSMGGAGLALTGLTGAAQAARKNVIKVELWDKGAKAEMAMNLGIGGTGDKSKATMGLALSSNTANAGKVTFNVVNTSKDTVHEVVILPYKEGKALPYSDKDMRIDEEAAGHLGEVSELQPGKSGSVTLDLNPGKYLLVCNIAGHYMNGMWEIVTLK